MLTPSQQQWLRDQTEPEKRRQSELITSLVSTESTPSVEPGESLFMWRARNILARERSSDSSPAPASASSDSAESSRDDGSDIGRIRDVVINPRYVK